MELIRAYYYYRDYEVLIDKIFGQKSYYTMELRSIENKVKFTYLSGEFDLTQMLKDAKLYIDGAEDDSALLGR